METEADKKAEFKRRLEKKIALEKRVLQECERFSSHLKALAIHFERFIEDTESHFEIHMFGSEIYGKPEMLTGFDISAGKSVFKIQPEIRSGGNRPASTRFLFRVYGTKIPQNLNTDIFYDDSDSDSPWKSEEGRGVVMENGEPKSLVSKKPITISELEDALIDALT
ncbi:MAG TPA: hypothetical protein VK914_03405 [bacterium]|jgi:hypothetical protein|nr:hypothetical protein [bacterium]